MKYILGIVNGELVKEKQGRYIIYNCMDIKSKKIQPVNATWVRDNISEIGNAKLEKGAIILDESKISPKQNETKSKKKSLPKDLAYLLKDIPVNLTIGREGNITERILELENIDRDGTLSFKFSYDYSSNFTIEKGEVEKRCKDYDVILAPVSSYGYYTHSQTILKVKITQDELQQFLIDMRELYDDFVIYKDLVVKNKSGRIYLKEEKRRTNIGVSDCVSIFYKLGEMIICVIDGARKDYIVSESASDSRVYFSKIAKLAEELIPKPMINGKPIDFYVNYINKLTKADDDWVYSVKERDLCKVNGSNNLIFSQQRVVAKGMSSGLHTVVDILYYSNGEIKPIVTYKTKGDTGVSIPQFGNKRIGILSAAIKKGTLNVVYTGGTFDVDLETLAIYNIK